MLPLRTITKNLHQAVIEASTSGISVPITQFMDARGQVLDIDLLDHQNRTALTVAVLLLDTSAAAILLNHGANPRASSSNIFCQFLIETIRQHHAWGIKALLVDHQQNAILNSRLHQQTVQMFASAGYHHHTSQHGSGGLTYKRVYTQEVKRAVSSRTSSFLNKVLQGLHEQLLLHEQDEWNRTCLSDAALMGDVAAVQSLLDHGANSLQIDIFGRSPLDYATAQGYDQVAAVLRGAVAAASHEPASHEPAPLQPLQRPVKDEVMPSRSTDVAGGWSMKRLPALDIDDACNIFQVDGPSMTANLFFRHVVLDRQPIMIRNWDMSKWAATTRWRKENMIKLYGHMRHNVGQIPYSTLYGGNESNSGGMRATTFEEYVQSMPQRLQANMSVPLYWFQAIFDNNHDLVKDTAMPWFLNDNMDVSSYTVEPLYWQFFAGSAGSGSQPHLHEHAWNIVVYGSKRWFLWSPGASFTSNLPTLTWLRESPNNRRERRSSFSCTQNAGDMIIVPTGYGHSTIALTENVGMSSEFRIIKR